MLLKLLKEKFMQFSDATGLKVNLAKSQLYFGGVNGRDKDEVLHILGYEEGSLPVRSGKS